MNATPDTNNTWILDGFGYRKRKEYSHPDPVGGLSSWGILGCYDHETERYLDFAWGWGSVKSLGDKSRSHGMMMQNRGPGCVCLLCLYVYMCITCVLVPVEARGGTGVTGGCGLPDALEDEHAYPLSCLQLP